MAHRGIERLCVVVVELSFETWQAYLAFWLAGARCLLYGDALND